MSDVPAIDPEAFFARLAALDMAAAERAHGHFMAAEETKDVVELGRTYQRMVRSLRQTLAAYARVRREAAAPPRAAARTPWSLPEHIRAQAPPDDPDLQDAIDDLDVAVQARVRAEYDPSEAEALDEEIDEVFDELVDDEFVARPLSEQVDAVMARLRPSRRAAAVLEAEPDDDDEPEPEPPPAPPPDAPAGDPALDVATEPAPADPPPPDPPPPDPPPPDPPAPEPWPTPYAAPWERLPPGGRFPGGTGW